MSNDMKTFVVIVQTPMKRAGKFHAVRGFVGGVNTAEEAIQAAKDFYPPTVTGWPKDAKFNAVEVENGKFIFS